MFFYLSFTLLLLFERIFEIIDYTEYFQFLCVYYVIIYIFVENFKIHRTIFLNTNGVFFVFSGVIHQTSKVSLFLVNCVKQYKQQLKWKPLFKKTSYFGFFRNSKNNNLNK